MLRSQVALEFTSDEVEIQNFSMGACPLTPIEYTHFARVLMAFPLTLPPTTFPLIRAMLVCGYEHFTTTNL